MMSSAPSCPNPMSSSMSHSMIGILMPWILTMPTLHCFVPHCKQRASVHGTMQWPSLKVFLPFLPKAMGWCLACTLSHELKHDGCWRAATAPVATAQGHAKCTSALWATHIQCAMCGWRQSNHGTCCVGLHILCHCSQDVSRKTGQHPCSVFTSGSVPSRLKFTARRWLQADEPRRPLTPLTGHARLRLLLPMTWKVNYSQTTAINIARNQYP